MSGYVGDLSPQQEAMLAQLKEKTGDVHKSKYDDYYYLRWLRARNFDAKKAEAMMRKNLVFRKKFGADTILENYKPPEMIDKHYPRGLLGPDKKGCPVRYMPFKNLDLQGLAYSVKKHEVLKFLTYIFEQDIEMMSQETKKFGKEIEKHSFIVDLDGYTFRQATNIPAVDMLNEILKLYEANYPERMKTTFFINAPSYFSLVLALSKPFLSEATLNKFQVYGKDGYQEILLQEIDDNILPIFLGGNRTDSDGNTKCLSIIHYGAMVPKSCYFSHGNSERKFSEEPGVSNICLEKRSAHLVEIPVQQTDERLQCEFQTMDHDLGVGLLFKHSEDKLEEVLPVERVDCRHIPESFVHICEKAGTYVLKFDNTYSWFTSKKVSYKISITSPNNFEESEKL